MKNPLKYTFATLLISLISFSSCSTDDTLYIDAKDVLVGEWVHSYGYLELECYPEVYKDTLKSYYMKKLHLRTRKSINIELNADLTFSVNYAIVYDKENTDEGQITGRYDYSSQFLNLDPNTSTSAEVELKKKTLLIDTLGFDRVKFVENRASDLINSAEKKEFWDELGIPKPEKFAVLRFRQYAEFKKVRDL